MSEIYVEKNNFEQAPNLKFYVIVNVLGLYMSKHRREIRNLTKRRNKHQIMKDDLVIIN
jgi:hypothetical protein